MITLLHRSNWVTFEAWLNIPPKVFDGFAIEMPKTKILGTHIQLKLISRFLFMLYVIYICFTGQTICSLKTTWSTGEGAWAHSYSMAVKWLAHNPSTTFRLVIPYNLVLAYSYCLQLYIIKVSLWSFYWIVKLESILLCFTRDVKDWFALSTREGWKDNDAYRNSFLVMINKFVPIIYFNSFML